MLIASFTAVNSNEAIKLEVAHQMMFLALSVSESVLSTETESVQAHLIVAILAESKSATSDTAVVQSVAVTSSESSSSTESEVSLSCTVS
jgi:hypothetical protein